jgi:hypothetical protein
MGIGDRVLRAQKRLQADCTRSCGGYGNSSYVSEERRRLSERRVSEGVAEFCGAKLVLLASIGIHASLGGVCWLMPGSSQSQFHFRCSRHLPARREYQWEELSGIVARNCSSLRLAEEFSAKGKPEVCTVRNSGAG